MARWFFVEAVWKLPNLGCWQPTEAAHPVPKTLQKQGASEIIWFQAGTIRIG